MLVLDATTKKIQVKTDAVTTTESPVVVSWDDITTTLFTPGASQTITTNTTAVDAVAAPGASTQRAVKYLSLTNADSVARVVTWIYNDNATLRNILIVTLQVGDTITYANGQWTQTTKTGLITANFIYAGPSSGGSGPASFRAMVAADMPNAGVATTDLVGTWPALTVAGGAIITSKTDVTNNGGMVHQWKNIVDNPQGMVAQRADYVTASPGVYGYGKCDRWKGCIAGTTAVGTLTQDTAALVGNSGFAVKWSSITTTGSGVTKIRIGIEAKNAAKFASRTAVASANVRQDTGGTVTTTINVYRMNSTDLGIADANLTLIGGSGWSTPSATNTAISTGLSIPSTGNAGLCLEITCAVGAVTSKNVWMTDIQLQLGSTVTPCEERPFQVELSRCQRYFETSFDDGVTFSSALGSSFIEYQAAAVNAQYTCYFKVKKRVGSTATLYSPNSGTASKVFNVSAGADQTPGFDASNQNHFSMNDVSATATQIIRFNYVVDCDF